MTVVDLNFLVECDCYHYSYRLHTYSVYVPLYRYLVYVNARQGLNLVLLFSYDFVIALSVKIRVNW